MTSASPEDVNAQPGQWLPLANARLVRRTGTRPSELTGQDKEVILGLPPIPPVTGFAARARPPRDYYTRMGSTDYSVHQQAIGRCVDGTANSDTVTGTLEGRCVGKHTRPREAD